MPNYVKTLSNKVQKVHHVGHHSIKRYHSQKMKTLCEGADAL